MLIIINIVEMTENAIWLS